MTGSDEKLPRAWFTPCGHEDFWAAPSTYGLIPFEGLPALDSSSQNGGFSWLPERPPDDCPLQFEQFERNVGKTLEKLTRDAAAMDVQLPESFLTFMSDPDIHSRVPTNTACYLDLSNRLIEIDGRSDAKLLRFMNDQQCVLLWYLYLQVGSPVSVVFADPQWSDEAPGDTLDDVITPTNLTVCAESFEEFIFRFWIENAIWFALYEKRELSEPQEAYRQAAAGWTPKHQAT
jgi:hypothetical protein